MLFPAIIAFCCIRVYAINSNSFDLYKVSFFGALGYLLIKLGCEPTPLVLGFILGPMIEEYLRRAMILADGDPLAIVSRPISAGLRGAAALMLIFVSIPAVRSRKQDIFVEE